VEDWGEEIFSEGVGLSGINGQGGRGRGRKIHFFRLPNPILPLHQPSTGQATVTIQDGSIEPIYLAIVSRSEIHCRLTTIHINNTLHTLQCGASWFVHLTPDRVLQVQALAGDTVLCSWARHLTIIIWYLFLHRSIKGYQRI